jgi:hypothetical protein
MARADSRPVCFLLSPLFGTLLPFHEYDLSLWYLQVTEQVEFSGTRASERKRYLA